MPQTSAGTANRRLLETHRKVFAIHEQRQLILTNTSEERLRDTTISLYTNDGVILALILSTISTDMVTPIQDSIFGQSTAFPAALVPLVSCIGLYACVAGISYTLHITGELNGAPDAKAWLQEMGPMRSIAIPVLAANTSLWMFLISQCLRIALTSPSWIGAVVIVMTPVLALGLSALGAKPTKAKLVQLQQLQGHT